MAQVQIDQVTKVFRGEPPTVAADALSLTIEDGELVVMLGPSGCGKTAALRCLAGLERPDDGRHAPRRWVGRAQAALTARLGNAPEDVRTTSVRRQQPTPRRPNPTAAA